MTDFERALANMEYDDDHTPAQLAAEAKARGNKAFGLGKEYHPNALRYWKVSRHATQCLSQPLTRMSTCTKYAGGVEALWQGKGSQCRGKEAALDSVQQPGSNLLGTRTALALLG